MSEDILLRIIAQDQYSQEMKEARAAVDSMTEAEKKSMLAAKDHASALSSLGKSVVVVNQGTELAGRVIGKVGEALEQTVGKTIEYNKSIRDLSQNLAIGTEETSRIVQTADDFTVSQDAVTTALQMAVKKGMKPSIDTLAQMADEYNNISDPTERAARLTEVFGRNWTALTPMLKEGGQAIRDAAKSQSDALIVTEEQAAATRELEKRLDALGDSIEGVKLKVGNALAPAITKSADIVSKFTDIVTGSEDPISRMNRELEYSIFFYGENSDAVKKQRAELEDYKKEVNNISDQEKERNRLLAEAAAEMRAVNQAYIGSTAGMQAYSAAAREANNIFADQTVKMSDLKTVIAGAVQNENKNFGKSQDDLVEKAAKLRDEIEKLKAANGTAYTSTKKATLSDNERAAAQAKLAAVTEDLTSKTRKKNETDAEFSSRMADLQVQSDKLTDKINGATGAVTGYIDNSKKIGELSAEYDDVNKAIDENVKAHQMATNKIIFGYAEQQLAVDGFTSVEAEALDQLAIKLGLKSKEDVDALNAIKTAGQQLAKDGSIANYTATITGYFSDAEVASRHWRDELAKIPRDIVTKVRVSGERDISGEGASPNGASPTSHQSSGTVVHPSNNTTPYVGGHEANRTVVNAPTNMTINAPRGMDVGALADAVSQRIARQTRAARNIGASRRL